MADRQLTIKLVIDDSQANAAARRQVAALAQVERAARSAADARERATRRADDASDRAAAAESARIKRLLAESEAAERLKVGQAQASARAQTSAAAGVAAAHQRLGQAGVQAQVGINVAARRATSGLGSQAAAANAAAGAYRNLGQAGVGSMVAISTSTVAATIGLQKLLGLAGELGGVLDKAGQKIRGLTAGFGDQRAGLAELAAIQGKRLDNRFALGFARYGRDTGMRPEEALAFQTELTNSGEQFRNAKISDKEFEQYKVQAGQLAVTRGLEPKVAGNLAGNILGNRDYRRFGAQASEVALGKLNSSLAILGRGKGDNKILAEQFSRITSGMLNEEELKGVFQDEDEAAIATSVVAEMDPSEADTLVRAAARGLRGFEPKKGGGGPSELLGRAGITPQTKFIESIKRLAPVVVAEARQKNVKVQDVLAEHFADERTRRALSVFINKGVEGGVIADREAFAGTVQGPAPALGLIDEFEHGEAGLRRRADAGIKLAEAERGAEGSRAEILRKQAIEEMVRDKSLESTAGGLQDFLIGKGSFGVLANGEQRRIDRRAAEILARRGKAAGLRDDFNLARGGVMPLSINHAFSEEGQVENFNRAFGLIERAGMDPLTGERLAPAAPPARAAAPGPDKQAALPEVFPDEPAPPDRGGLPAGGLRGLMAMQALAAVPPPAPERAGGSAPAEMAEVAGLLRELVSMARSFLQIKRPQDRPAAPAPLRPAPGQPGR